MNHQPRLQVEVYSHGGWWKDSRGRTGQVLAAQADKGPMATVATVANGFGTEGWALIDLVSAHHNTYLLTFVSAGATTADANGDDQRSKSEARSPVSTTLG